MSFPGLERLCKLLWGATLLTLPVTSFRYFPAGEGTFVRPLAFFPLALLLLGLSWLALKGQQRFPKAPAFTPLAAFILVALAASLVGILLAPIPLRGNMVVDRVVRAWITLLMGVAFFVAAVWMNRSEADVRFSVRWMLAGFVIDLLWSALQAATFYLQILPKPVVSQWQRLFSLRELIRTNRISGMAYEPSWLAGQIATLYMPWLIAAVLTRVRVTRLRWLEPALLVAALILVAATFSRGGILTSLLSAILTVVLVGRRELRHAWQWLTSTQAGARQFALRLAVIATGVILLAAGSVLLAQKGYISRLWNTRAADISEFLIQNSAGARGAYFASAMETYAQHPWTGVGLGSSGFYMYTSLPDWALTTVPEIARQLSPESTLYPNPKSLYVRLLAETGVPGFTLFIALLFMLLGDAWIAAREHASVRRLVGIAGICTWIALLFYNSTQDSFATPNLWINLGILAGVTASQWKSQE